MNEPGPTIVHRASCHCGAVSFEVDALSQLNVIECNCRICVRSGFLHLLVAKLQFRLLSGAAVLRPYRFNTGVAEHLFCRVCGVKPFYVPRSHPDGYSINVRCLDPMTIGGQTRAPFEGKNWELNIEQIR